MRLGAYPGNGQTHRSAATGWHWLTQATGRHTGLPLQAGIGLPRQRADTQVCRYRLALAYPGNGQTHRSAATGWHWLTQTTGRHTGLPLQAGIGFSRQRADTQVCRYRLALAYPGNGQTHRSAATGWHWLTQATGRHTGLPLQAGIGLPRQRADTQVCRYRLALAYPGNGQTHRSAATGWHWLTQATGRHTGLPLQAGLGFSRQRADTQVCRYRLALAYPGNGQTHRSAATGWHWLTQATGRHTGLPLQAGIGLPRQRADTQVCRYRLASTHLVQRCACVCDVICRKPINRSKV